MELILGGMALAILFILAIWVNGMVEQANKKKHL